MEESHNTKVSPVNYFHECALGLVQRKLFRLYSVRLLGTISSMKYLHEVECRLYYIWDVNINFQFNVCAHTYRDYIATYSLTKQIVMCPLGNICNDCR